MSDFGPLRGMFETRSSLFKSYFILIDFIFEYALQQVCPLTVFEQRTLKQYFFFDFSFFTVAFPLDEFIVAAFLQPLFFLVE